VPAATAGVLRELPIVTVIASEAKQSRQKMDCFCGFAASQ
jgi:hypothetical protein